MKPLLFITSIINEDWTRLTVLITAITILYSCVFLSVLIDLYFGVKRAKRLNIARTSYGYRRTITKMTNYFGLMLMLSIADVAASLIKKLPYFTVIGAIGIIAVEAKSVYENISQTEANVTEAQKILLKLFNNKDVIKEILNYLNQTNNEKAN